MILCGGLVSVDRHEDDHGPFVATTFHDGAFVLARPMGDAHWEWRHDFVHSMLADYLGWSHSPTLWRLAHPGSPDVCSDSFVAIEESAVANIIRHLSPLRA